MSSFVGKILSEFLHDSLSTNIKDISLRGSELAVLSTENNKSTITMYKLYLTNQESYFSPVLKTRAGRSRIEGARGEDEYIVNNDEDGVDDEEEDELYADVQNLDIDSNQN